MFVSSRGADFHPYHAPCDAMMEAPMSERACWARSLHGWNIRKAYFPLMWRIPILDGLVLRLKVLLECTFNNVTVPYLLSSFSSQPRSPSACATASLAPIELMLQFAGTNGVRRSVSFLVATTHDTSRHYLLPLRSFHFPDFFCSSYLP